MIRREQGEEFLLIRQDDHAHLSRELAEHLGNGSFQAIARSPRGESALIGMGLHDEGWPLQDDAPALNGRGQPRDVFEPRPDALKLWAESSRRAAAVDPYAGLLVSLHVLSLSVIALNEVLHQYSRQNTAYTRDRFELNKFQHGQIELQQTLRTQLGLRTDLPLHYGLSEPGVEPAEDLLIYHFRTLQAMDRLSLALCCTQPPFDAVELFPGIDAKPARISLQRTGPYVLDLRPWPFREAHFAVAVAARAVPSRLYPSEADFHAIFNQSPLQMIQFTLSAESI